MHPKRTERSILFVLRRQYRKFVLPALYQCCRWLQDLGVVVRCGECKQLFCYDCDLYIHETLHNCPGCETMASHDQAANSEGQNGAETANMDED